MAIRSPCGSTKPKSNPLGEYEKHYEVALSTTTLPGFSAETRIATPRRYKLRILRPGFSGGKARSQPLRCIAFSGPHRCAPVPILHWFAMTCRNLPGVCGCKNVVHNDMLKTGTRLRMHGRGARWHLPHCHCEERSGNPFSLRGCLYTRQPLWGLNYSLEGQHQQNAGGQHHRGAQPYPHHRLALLGLGRIQETYPPQAHDHRLVQQQGHRAVDAPLE